MTRDEKVTALINEIQTDPDKLNQLLKIVFTMGISQATDDKIDQLYAALNPDTPVTP